MPDVQFPASPTSVRRLPSPSAENDGARPAAAARSAGHTRQPLRPPIGPGAGPLRAARWSLRTATARRVCAAMVAPEPRAGPCDAAPGPVCRRAGRQAHDARERDVRVHAARMLVFSVDLPVTAQVTTASARAPYLGFKLEFDPYRVAELALRVFPAAVPTPSAERGMYVGQPPRPSSTPSRGCCSRCDSPPRPSCSPR